jgi:hypothetical protein
MKRVSPYFVVALHDLRTLTTVEQTFTQFPVSIGRGGGNRLRLDARAVSRRHGVFAHREGSLVEYMDLGSKNGSFVDGIQIDANVPVPLRDSNVVTVNPFQITFHVLHGRPRADRRVTAPIELPPVGPPEVSLWKATLARSEAMRRVRSEHGPSDLLRRAAEVIELVAEMIVLFRPPRRSGGSVLRSSTAPDEIAAFLLSPASGARALHDLRDLLAELFTTPTSGASR